MLVTENAVTVNVRLVSNHATSSFLVRTINVPQGVIHHDATHATKLKKSPVFVAILESLFLVGWNVQQNHQSAVSNARRLQIAIICHVPHILVILGLVLPADRHVIKF